jgi:hypothetical protein
MRKYLLSIVSIFMMVNTFAQTCEQQYPNVDFTMIEDCNGNCIPAGWSGDNACDDGGYMYNISEEAYCQNFNPNGDNYCDYIVDLSGYVTIYLNCEEANFDDGDCEPIPDSPSGCLFNTSEFGASDCSEAYIHFGLTYSELELDYGWDCSGCMDELALISGCMDELACNYNSDAIYEDICPTCSCVYIEPNDSCSVCSGESDGTGTVVDNDIDNDGICESDEVLGCTDTLSFNYDELAEVNDGSCIEVVGGCMDASAFNYDSLANTEDGSCQYDSSYHQIIPLPSGWSSFSSYITPEVSSIDIVLSEIYENVIIAKDYLGQAYLPDWNFNAIGNLNHHQGYQIKTIQECTLNIEGTYVSPQENPNNLPSGWFMMGYLRLEGVPMDLLLADLVEEQYITIVKDYLGQAYLPDWNFNAIGDANPGFGYQIKTIQECTLEYLPNNMSYRLASSLKVIENRSSYFPRAIVTDNNMTLIIEDRAWDVLPNQNTEIQALDSENNIVGSALYTSPTSVITLWGDDRHTSKKDGLDVNEQVQFKLWDREQIRDFVIKDWVKGSSAYQINAINIASSIFTENSTLEANDIGAKPFVRIINLLGQEVQEENIERTGQFLFKVYDDGSVERFIK